MGNQRTIRRKRVLLTYMRRNVWFCAFLEEDAKTSLPRKVVLTDPNRLFEMAERGGAQMTAEDRQAIEHGIEIGRGAFWLNLTEEQYAALKKK